MNLEYNKTVKKFLYLIGLNLISSCFASYSARPTESDYYKFIPIGKTGAVAEVFLSLATFVNADGEPEKDIERACVLIARPGTNYVTCTESGPYGLTTEYLVMEQTDFFELIFESINTLLNSSVYDINDFTQQLSNHFTDAFGVSPLGISPLGISLLFRVKYMDLQIGLTNSIFRAIAHEAIKFAEFLGPGSQKSQFKIPLKPIFDTVARVIHENPQAIDLAERVTTAVDTYIDSIYA